MPKDAVIVVGGARGADRIAEQVARRMGFRVEVYLDRWNEEGKDAGYRRNERVRDLPGVKGAFGFRMPGKSNGTDHMAGTCKEAGIETTVQLPARMSPVTV